jgi:hypothetical protein
MAAPLNNDQKRILAKLATRAFQRECALARGRGERPQTDTPAATAFRRREVVRATGKAGLRCCSQDDYGAVKGHFLNLLGEAGQAFEAIHHGEGNARRIAEFKLLKACETAHLPLSYVAKICANQFKCALEEATEKQLWCLMFTVQNRGRKVTFSREVAA